MIEQGFEPSNCEQIEDGDSASSRPQGSVVLVTLEDCRDASANGCQHRQNNLGYGGGFVPRVHVFSATVLRLAESFHSLSANIKHEVIAGSTLH